MKNTNRPYKFIAVFTVLLLGILSPAFSQITVFDDLEAGTNQNKFLGYWYFYTDIDDGGNSVVNNATVSGAELLFDGSYGEGREGSAHSAILDYTFGTTEPSCGGTCTFGNFAGIGSEFIPAGSVLDMTTATTLQFWMKGSAADMTVRVEVATKDIIDFGYYRIEAAVGTGWQQYTIDFADFISFTQPSWADPVPFNKAMIEKIQFAVSAEDANPAAGKVWIDDITVNGYVWVPPTICSTIGAAGAPVGAKLIDFDGTIETQNAVGEYSYAYNDAAGRTVTAGQYTDVFGGVNVDPLDPTVIDLAIAGNGNGGTNGAFIEFQLGPAYVEGATTVQPFAGIGTRVGDNLGLSFYNAQNDGATGVYFDYMTTGVDWLMFEVHSNQDFGNAGIVHHCLAPGSEGAWRSASVPFGSSLFLPDWDEVRALPPAMQALKTDALEKFQWSYHGAPGTQASFAVDNVHLMGATAISDVKPKQKRAKQNIGIQVNASQLLLNVNGTLKDARITLKTVKGKRVYQNTLSNLQGSLTLDTEGYTPGVYYIGVEAIASNGKTVKFNKPVTLLK